MKTLVYFLVALARQQWLPILGNLLASFFGKKSMFAHR